MRCRCALLFFTHRQHKPNGVKHMNRKSLIEAINAMRTAAGHAPIDGRYVPLATIRTWHAQHKDGIF
ncbi:hypothetical protein CPT_Summit_036 [Stenotrophomonas phage Summit]|nr:hypothetical protein CPT_Summit_036 [Stenotrophomonas phage Summit]